MRYDLKKNYTNQYQQVVIRLIMDKFDGYIDRKYNHLFLKKAKLFYLLSYQDFSNNNVLRQSA